MNPNHHPTPSGRRRARRAVRRFTRALADLTAAGRAHGIDAAGWWQQDSIGGRVTGDVAATAAQVLAGLEDLDPQVLDTLPGMPLHDTLLERLYTEHTGRAAPTWARLTAPQRVRAVDAYRDAYDQALHQQVESYCRQVLDTTPAADGGHRPAGGHTPPGVGR